MKISFTVFLVNILILVNYRSAFGKNFYKIPELKQRNTGLNYRPNHLRMPKHFNSLKYRYTIVLKTDSILNTYSKINISDTVHTITIKNKKERRVVSPKETREIFRVDDDGYKIAGIPVDSCWLFKCCEGRITCYSFLPESGSVYAVAIQKGENSPIVALNKPNLKQLTDNDPYLTKLIDKGKFLKVIHQYNKNPHRQRS